jgi:hypothetical protein
MKLIKKMIDSTPWRASVAALATAGMMAACGGGGGGGGGVGSGGTGEAASFASGRISGLGSIIVNGVRYDDSGADISDDSGATYSSDDLKLGMVVEVEGGPVTRDATTGTATATASSIRVSSELKGAVEAVDAAGGTLTVFGQEIEVDDRTVYEGFNNGLAAIQVGDQVEVYAFHDIVSGTYLATRIEEEDDADEFKVRGIVSNLDEGNETFDIGNATISYADIPVGDRPVLSNGATVRVEAETAQQGGVWVATELEGKTERDIDDDTEIELEGVVTDFTSLASFRVNGIAVNAAGSGVEFDDGAAGDVADGVRIEVEGTVQDGVLVATKVEFEDNDDDGNGDDDENEIELHGAVESLDANAGTLVVRGYTVSFSDQTQFDDGAAADLDVGVQVEVKGRLAPSGTSVIAAEIDFEDGDEDDDDNDGDDDDNDDDNDDDDDDSNDD